MSVRTIPRESGDTSKGFTLQKLRATSLMLTYLNNTPPNDFLAAVEFAGDIYLDTERKTYLEENKAYESKDFSFASVEVKNTMVYFLDYWLNNKRNTAIRFGFYATNKIVKEINSKTVKGLEITLPDHPILELLIEKKYAEENFLPTVKKIVLNEYYLQYKDNEKYPLDKSHYSDIEKFDDADWIAFLDNIDWQFEQDDISVLEDKVLKQISEIKFAGINIEGKEPFIRAQLFYELELRQIKTKSEERFITADYIELTYRRVATSGIDENSYKFLSLDYEDIRQKTKQNLQQFISDKYFAITGNRNKPLVLHRKVALFDPSQKIKSKTTETFEPSKDYKIEGLFNSFVNSEKPIFLFGELGSGKSTIVANYLLSIIDENPEIVPLFLPSSYLQDKEFNSIENFIDTINRYINNEILIPQNDFDFNILFKTNKETILIIDGIDELLISRSQLLITTLKKLKASSSHLRIIATGRPLELEAVVPSGWHTLATIPLRDEEIKVIFLQEALAANVSEEHAIADVESRLMILKSRNELYAIASTPLVVCSIWPDLTDSIQGKSLGDLLYNVILRRLSWHEKDQKELELKAFLENYPINYQREGLLTALAKEIFYSSLRAISEETIINILTARIPESAQKNKIVHEANTFFKTVFLQRTTDDKYGFISAPLLECSVAIGIAEELKQLTQTENFFDNWRALSFAMAISRRKEETNQIRDNISLILNKELNWPNINIAPIAIILAELRDATLANQFIEIIQKMEFRPIRLIEQNDQLTSYSIAYCLTLAEDKGFNWLFSEYLTCKTPLIHYEAKLISDILGYYFLINDFKIILQRQQQLNSIIQPNINFTTALCFELLPCLSLIATRDLPIRQKCLLLADLLKDDFLRFKAEDSLKEIAAINQSDVLNALETVCQKTEFTENPRAAILWLRVNNSRSLSKSILANALASITKANLQEIFTALNPYISDENLIAYLRFCIVTGNKLAAQASLILFWKGHRDFDLLSHALITSIDWLSQQYGEINDIAEFIASKKEIAIKILIRNMPLSNHLGIPPAYWKIFLNALNNTDQLYLSAFETAVENMRFFILTRYPDIRIGLTALLNNKPIYKELLKRVSKDLSTNLRANANAILLTSFPDQEAEILRKIVSGFFDSSSDSAEWQSFCFGLNYNRETLDELYQHLGDFVEGAKTYALTLLYYHKYDLKGNEINDLVKGSLGPGYFFGRSTKQLSDTQSGILSHPSFFDKVIPYLKDPENERAERAASTLIDYHNDNLTDEQKAIAWTLRIESYQKSFFEFSLTEEALFSNQAFIEGVLKYSKTKSTDTLLALFCETFDDSKAWYDFFLRIITKSERFDHGILLELHNWLISFNRRYEDKKEIFAETVKDLLLIPSYKENLRDNNIYLSLLLIADEFQVADKVEIINSIQSVHQFVNEELYCALALRSDFKIPRGYIRDPFNSYITLFATYQPSFIAPLPEDELQRYLIDSENLPKDLLAKIEQIILLGHLEKEQLDSICEKSKVGAYFSILIGFCRNKPVHIEKLLEIREIGGVKTYQLPETKAHRDVIRKLYRHLLNSEDNRKIYIDSLKKELENPNTEHFTEYLLELIAEGEVIEFQYIEKLLVILLDKPYLLKETLAYYLSGYFSDHIKVEENKKYKTAIENFLSAIINRFANDRHDDDRFNLILWLFSLALLKVSDKVSDIAKHSFLLGLRYVFLEKNSLNRALLHPPEIFFKAGDLFHYTDILFDKVDLVKIKKIISEGVNSNIPEIRSCCRILYALSGRY